jgi:hypothetical protein
MSIPANTPNPAPRFEPPLYGQAAAIYAMYQGVFLEREQDQERPRPRKPRAGLRDRLARTVTSLLGAPAYAHATP